MAAAVAPKIRKKKTIPYNFGEKHKQYIRNCHYCTYNVAEGAVRAGKTVDNVVAFCHELCTTPDKLHLASASTAPTAKLIIGDCNGFGIEHYFRGQCHWGKYKGNEALIIKGPSTGFRERIILFVGGAKINSHAKFRGASIGMWIATEIDLHHEETIKEAFKRQAAAKRRKIFWDLNPRSPFATIYTQFIDAYAKKYEDGELIGGWNYQLFTIRDNINIPDSDKEAFISLYTPGSVEYMRAIEGKRCAAEGLIFQQFADHSERFIISKKPKNLKFITVGVDFGGNKSATTFVANGIGNNFDSITTIADHKMKGAKGTIDPSRMNRELIEFVRYVQSEYPRTQIVGVHCDNEAQTLINGIRMAFKAAQIKVPVLDCIKLKITERIYALNGFMTEGRYFVMKDCVNIINSLSTQVWDDKDPTEDIRLDNGTIDIDTADANEYSWSPWIQQLKLRGVELIKEKMRGG